MGANAQLAANQYNIERIVPMTVDQYNILIEKSQSRKNSLRARLLRAKGQWS
jgi:hypothetical protein